MTGCYHFKCLHNFINLDKIQCYFGFVPWQKTGLQVYLSLVKNIQRFSLRPLFHMDEQTIIKGRPCNDTYDSVFTS